MDDRDKHWMSVALQLASRGRGYVEPNPMVGCVVVDNDEVIATGYHSFFGGPHAEVEAVSKCNPGRIGQATVYVTLEPCSHFGKTPPCVDLLLRQRPNRVVIAMQDPFPAVAGRGIQVLRENAIDVTVGVLEEQSRELNAPYLKLLSTGMPWVIAKWAMTLDGAIATHGQDSKWISNERSRAVSHQIRGRMDAIIIGIGTAIADDPMLTARLPFDSKPARVANRIVMDRTCQLSPQSKLVQSTDQGPVIVASSELSDEARVRLLKDAGCEILFIPERERQHSLGFLLKELGKRRNTNVLLEGGGTLLGHAFDEGLVDEIHCFIAPKIVGGLNAIRPIAGFGRSLMNDADQMQNVTVERLGDDVHIQGILRNRRLKTSSK